ncbi:MAG: TerD family protein [Nocardiopsaceae bacterium]|nr:TerD family protein [Nocardiopsaceae bacterium]
MGIDLTEAVIARRHRVPLPEAEPGDGAAVARQLDAALMSAGFKLSRELFTGLSCLPAGQVMDLGVTVLRAVRVMAGDHVEHNPYFIDFPANVPETLEFWAELAERALAGGAVPDGALVDIGDGEMAWAGNLLSLPGYGTAAHAYEDMLAAHEALATSAGDRITVLHAGGTLQSEVASLFLDLAGSTVPLPREDVALLGVLAAECADGPRPEAIPVRENRAVINQVALAHGNPLLVDTVTDVLRLAAAASGGDATLETATRFRSFSRRERRVIMAALDGVVSASAAKLGDVPRYAERWKRIGERLHPHEYPAFPAARRVFAVARGEEKIPSLAAEAERRFRSGVPAEAARLLARSPGLMFRSLDRLLRSCDGSQADDILALAARTAPEVSGRVLLSAREHFQNRGKLDRAGRPRIFPGRSGRTWVAPESRAGLDPAIRDEVLALLDETVASRLPETGRLIVDPALMGVALPLTGKPAAPGIGVLPRGSVTEVVPAEQDVLTFFTYWRQVSRRTDYDLSAQMTTRDFTRNTAVSWLNYNSGDGAVTYSGDITSAPEGATEFISADLRRVTMDVLIPQVHIYAGEGFDKAAEAFFGYMLRERDQKGAPFEAATVRMKSDLRGSGRVALPLAFTRGEDGGWRAKWLHFYLRGYPSMNIAEEHKATAGLLVRSVLEREYLQVRYLTSLWSRRTPDGKAHLASTDSEAAEAAAGASGPVTYLGLGRPEGLPGDATVFTPENLGGVIPD